MSKAFADVEVVLFEPKAIAEEFVLPVSYFRAPNVEQALFCRQWSSLEQMGASTATLLKAAMKNKMRMFILNPVLEEFRANSYDILLEALVANEHEIVSAVVQRGTHFSVSALSIMKEEDKRRCVYSRLLGQICANVS
jgi:hypothetical protein